MLEYLERERAGGRPIVAALVVSTVGSTYRKAGALMFLGAHGERLGLLSGGCLESDLAEHAKALLSSNERVFIKTYDSRASDDPIWGLGLGCEGAMRIALLRLEPQDGYAPIGPLLQASQQRVCTGCAIDLASGHSALFIAEKPTGDPLLVDIAHAVALSGRSTLQRTSDGREVFALAAERPPALLLCGAGPDAEPVALFAAILGWSLTIVDHRAAYVDANRFPARSRVLRVDATEIGAQLELASFDAAVVMSHHLVADSHYLGALADCPIPYIGLLGPAARRERLFAELGSRASPLIPKLRAPVGLDLGGRTPEAIALSMIAEIHAVLNGRSGARFSSQPTGGASPD